MDLKSFVSFLREVAGHLIDLWKSLKFVRKQAAEDAGVFFQDRSFWLPAYTYADGKIPGVATVLTDIYDAAPGGIVDLLVTPGGRIHRYRRLGSSVSPGSDHFVSPLNFHIEFWDTRSIDPAEVRIDRVKHWSDMVTTVFDQFGRHMPEFEGETAVVLPKILAAGWRDPYVHRIHKAWREDEAA